MKTSLICFILVAIAVIAQAQNKIVSNVFLTKIENGKGIEVPIKFDISKETQDSLKKKLNPNKDPKFNLANTLYMELIMMSGMVKLKLKNPTSYDLTPNSKGTIGIDSDGQMFVSYPFKAQNEIGNSVDRTARKKGFDLTIL